MKVLRCNTLIIRSACKRTHSDFGSVPLAVPMCHLFGGPARVLAPQCTSFPPPTAPSRPICPAFCLSRWGTWGAGRVENAQAGRFILTRPGLGTLDHQPLGRRRVDASLSERPHCRENWSCRCAWPTRPCCFFCCGFLPLKVLCWRQHTRTSHPKCPCGNRKFL